MFGLVIGEDLIGFAADEAWAGHWTEEGVRHVSSVWLGEGCERRRGTYRRWARLVRRWPLCAWVRA